jgi:DNA-binding winged helix-turn-helix (wHTH) protein
LVDKQDQWPQQLDPRRRRPPGFAAVRVHVRLRATEGFCVSATPPTCCVVRFGTFEVDLTSGELRRQGLKIHLPEQPFYVLACLLQHPGRLVTRDDLRAKLWPTGTFIDFDHGLNTAIYKIRRALADSPRSPRFVETVSRRGYRFLAPVEILEVKSPMESRSLAFFDWEEFWQGFLGESGARPGEK